MSSDDRGFRFEVPLAARLPRVRPARPPKPRTEGEAMTPLAVLRRWIDAFNRHDLESLVDCYHDSKERGMSLAPTTLLRTLRA